MNCFVWGVFGRDLPALTAGPSSIYAGIVQGLILPL